MIEQKIRQTLTQLHVAISRTDGGAITSVLKELDRLSAEHQREIDPRLLHFLQRRSYDKALDYLQGENGRSSKSAEGHS